MGKENNTIRISPDRIEETIAGLNAICTRLGALDAEKDRLSGDCGTADEERKEYDKMLTKVIELLKTMITVTITFLQKADSTFTETDQKLARRLARRLEEEK